jgi:hypothetical protein
MTIAAGLHLNTRAGRRGEIGSHQGGGTSQECKRTADHPAIANRDEFAEPTRIRFLENVDRISAVGWWCPRGMRLTGQGSAQNLAAGNAFFTGAKHGHGALGDRRLKEWILRFRHSASATTKPCNGQLLERTTPFVTLSLTL